MDYKTGDYVRLVSLNNSMIRKGYKIGDIGIAGEFYTLTHGSDACSFIKDEVSTGSLVERMAKCVISNEERIEERKRQLTNGQ